MGQFLPPSLSPNPRLSSPLFVSLLLFSPPSLPSSCLSHFSPLRLSHLPLFVSLSLCLLSFILGCVSMPGVFRLSLSYFFTLNVRPCLNARCVSSLSFVLLHSHVRPLSLSPWFAHCLLAPSLSPAPLRVSLALFARTDCLLLRFMNVVSETTRKCGRTCSGIHLSG